MKTRFYVSATYSEDGSNKRCQECQVIPVFYKEIEYFGDKDISKIDDEAFEKYKARRLETVSIATVDRELSKARKMFGVALSKSGFRRYRESV